MNNKSKSLNKSRLALIESKWHPKNKSIRNVTISGLFNLLCEFRYKDSHSFHYEMFNDKHAFIEITTRLMQQNGIHYFHIAAHGNNVGILGSNGDCIALNEIENVFVDIDRTRGRFYGVFFANCSFGQESTLKHLLQIKGNKIVWVAGYSKDVNEFEVSILDISFWQRVGSYKENCQKLKKTHEWTYQRTWF
jgi:hypothetical protein